MHCLSSGSVLHPYPSASKSLVCGCSVADCVPAFSSPAAPAQPVLLPSPEGLSVNPLCHSWCEPMGKFCLHLPGCPLVCGSPSSKHSTCLHACCPHCQQRGGAQCPVTSHEEQRGSLTILLDTTGSVTEGAVWEVRGKVAWSQLLAAWGAHLAGPWKDVEVPLERVA